MYYRVPLQTKNMANIITGGVNYLIRILYISRKFSTG